MRFASTPDDVRSITDAALAEAEALVSGATSTAGQGTFDQVLLPFDEASARLAHAYGSAAFMARVHPDAAVRDAGQAAEERLNRWRVDLVFRDDVAATVQAFAGSSAAAGLTGERRRFLDRFLRDLRRAGHGLDRATREVVRGLQRRMVDLESAFQRNIDEFDDGLDLTRGELDGMSDAYVAGLQAGALPGTRRVGMHVPEVLPFLEQANRRDLRRILSGKLANRARALNEPILVEALGLRRRIAALLGYPSWAHFSTEVKMAAEPGAIDRFYRGLVPPLQAKMAGEVARHEEVLARCRRGAAGRILGLALVPHAGPEPGLRDRSGRAARLLPAPDRVRWPPGADRRVCSG